MAVFLSIFLKNQKFFFQLREQDFYLILRVFEKFIESLVIYLFSKIFKQKHVKAIFQIMKILIILKKE